MKETLNYNHSPALQHVGLESLFNSSHPIYTSTINRKLLSLMSDYLGYVANFPLGGIEWTTEIGDGRRRYTRNLIHLDVDGLQLELRQDSSLPKSYSEIAGRWIHTTDVLVRNVAQQDFEKVRNVVGHVCELLSFATESRVLPYGYDYPADSVGGQRTSTVGTIQFWRPPFASAQDVKRFVELCYDRFVSKRGPRNLNVAIDYIYHSIAKDLALEPKIILACIAWENLRHKWALDARYPFLGGSFRERGATSASSPAVGLKRHLEEMFKEVGMSPDVQRIVKIRNEIIHTGLLNNPQNALTHDFLENVLREYFLRVVGYHGPFLPYAGGSPKAQVI